MTDNIDWIKYILGDDLELKALIDGLEAGFYDQDQFQEEANNLFEHRLEEAGVDKDYPFLLYFNSGVKDLTLGHTVTGNPIGLDLNDLKRGGIVIIALSGAGKTNLMVWIARNLSPLPCNMWFYETTKMTFRNVLDNALVITGGLLYLNRWIEPPGTNPIAYHSALVDEISNVCGFYAKGRAYIQKAVHQLDSEHGVYAGSALCKKS